MRNKCKIVALGSVVSCAIIVCVLCIPGAGSVEEEKHLDRIGALEIRVIALETQVAQLKELVDGIITKPQLPTRVDAEPTIDDKTKEIQSNARRQMVEAERNYKEAKENRERLGMARYAAKNESSKVRREIEDQYRDAIEIEEKAYWIMLNAQDRYIEILQPQPSK